MARETIFIGNEYDENLLRGISQFLSRDDVVIIDSEQWDIGSQSFWNARFMWDTEEFILSGETYEGVTLQGNSEKVNQLVHLLKDHFNDKL